MMNCRTSKEYGKAQRDETDVHASDGDRLYPDESFFEQYSLSKYQQDQHEESYADNRNLYDEQNFGTVAPLRCPSKPDQSDNIENKIQEVEESKKKIGRPFSLASLELLKNHGERLQRLNGERIIRSSSNVPYCAVLPAGEELSTEEIVRIAAKRYIQSSNSSVNVASLLENPFNFSSTGLSSEDSGNVELVEFLLASADKVSNQQYERAIRLLDYCDSMSFSTGNPVQRIVYYFSQALHERIDRETGKIKSEGSGKSQLLMIDHLLITPNSTIQACFEGIPFYRVAHLTAAQAIVENVGKAKRVHVIDLKIRNGLQWAALIHAFASQNECSLELLKITAMETPSENSVNDTGNRLTNFAQSMNIPFSFNIVIVSNMLDLEKELLNIENDEEQIAVYSEYALMNFIILQPELDSIMRVIRSINPCIVVVIETEANHNSSLFVTRFIEALFYFSAYFDCVDACMSKDDPSRMIMESLFLGEGIRNIVGYEGEERDVRNVKINVWRTFFARFGMVETEISELCLYQANLALQKFSCGKYCTIGNDEKSLIFEWKGTAIFSISTWKFNCQRREEE